MIEHRTRIYVATAIVAGLAILLGGCSRHTALTVRADLVAFLGSSNSVTVTYSSGTTQTKLPPNSTSPDAGYLVDLSTSGVPTSAVQAIDSLSLDVAIGVTPDTDLGAGEASIYIAPASENNIFQSQYAVSQVSASSLPANQTTTLSDTVTLDAASHPKALATVQSGSFRVGVEIQTTATQAGKADLTLKRLLVSVSLPPGYGLP